MREFDLVIFGATGFTGRLVADYVAHTSRHRPLRWAIAGRNADKLAQVRKELPTPEIPVILVDALDPAAVEAVARRTTVVCTTVGPYAKFGSALVAACAEAGTHYCDLTAEVPWMRQMIDAHHERAIATGAKIVHSCGFDSIPSDLGTFLVQREMIARHGSPATTVTALFGETSGGMSGGTLATMAELSTAARKDAGVRRVLFNPYALDPDPTEPKVPSPDDRSIGWFAPLKMFTVPFIMALSNTRIVRRSHALLGQPWGSEFRYREVMSTPGNAGGLAMAGGIMAGIAGLGIVLSTKPLRERLVQRFAGDGPSLETRTHGHWKVRFVAEHDGDQLVYIAADRADPGYGSTAKMLGESALCLALDPLGSPGGVLTPAVAMGVALAERLRSAGLTFAPSYA